MYFKDFSKHRNQWDDYVFYISKNSNTFNAKKICLKKRAYLNSVYSRIFSPSIRILIPTKNIDQNVLKRKKIQTGQCTIFNVIAILLKYWGFIWFNFYWPCLFSWGWLDLLIDWFRCVFVFNWRIFL